MDRSAVRRDAFIMLALVALAAALRLYGIGWGLPQLYEEAAPFHRAWNMWGWGPHKTFDPNPHFFFYPSLTIYLQFIAQGVLYAGLRLFGVIASTADFRVLHIVDKTPLIVTGRLVTALFGVAAVALTYRLGRRIAGRWMAVPAAFLLAVNTLHIAKSQVIEVDVPLTFFAVATLWFCVLFIEHPTRRLSILAAVSIGLAASSKYPGALLGLPLIAAHLIARRGTVRSSGGNAGTAGAAPTWRLLALAIAVAVGTFLVTSPFILLDMPTFIRHFSWERLHMTVGHFGLDESVTWAFYFGAFVRRMLGWPLTLLAFGGLLYFAAYRRRPWALVLAAFFVPFLIAVSNFSMRVDRYALPLVPVALLYAGGVLAELAGLPRLRRLPAVWRGTGAAVVVVLLAAQPLVATFPDHLERLKKDTRTEAQEWIEKNVPAGSFLAVELYGPELFGPHMVALLEEEVRGRVLERMKRTPNYAVQPIPMFSTFPERARPFYDLSLYGMADFIVTSSMVRFRYEREPARFERQIAFYEELTRVFEVVREFKPVGRPGPTITIYRNPDRRVPFGGRKKVRPPRPLRWTLEGGSAGEEIFYKNLGMNYEVFGHYEEALAAYELAFRYPILRAEVYNLLVVRKTLCLLALGRSEEAVAFLETAAAEARTAHAREYFARMQRQIRSRMRGR